MFSNSRMSCQAIINVMACNAFPTGVLGASFSAQA
jgi:hypothetical protein